MAKSIRLSFHLDPSRHMVVAEIRGLQESIGYSARFTINAEVEVHDSRGVNDDEEVFRHDFEIDRSVHRIEICLHSLNAFTYSGRMIDVRLHGKLVIDDAIIFDTTVEEEIALELTQKPAVNSNAKELIDPADAFSFTANFTAIPHHTKVMVLALLLIGGGVVAVNTIVGVHDQFASESATFFYSQRNSDGKSSSPLKKSLVLSGSAGAAVWAALIKQLRSYMRFKLKRLPDRIKRGQRLLVSELIEGSSRVDLEDITLRIVACNLEKGQYERGSGKEKRTVSFSEPTRALLLYSKHVDRIPCGQPVSRYFQDALVFDPMFSALYPPQAISSTHGIEVYWEVQLMHDEFVDQELQVPTEMFHYRDFWLDQQASSARSTAAS